MKVIGGTLGSGSDNTATFEECRDADISNICWRIVGTLLLFPKKQQFTSFATVIVTVSRQLSVLQVPSTLLDELLEKGLSES